MISHKKRAVKNTGYLYVKMIFSIVLTLYSTRLVINSLGVSDYGIFNLIAGVITMLAFLNAALTISSQRFISFYIGKGEKKKIQEIYSSSIVSHFVLGIVIVMILEIASIYVFDYFLNIPESRLYAAKLVFQFMVFSTFMTINAVPYDAMINAHEDIYFDAFSGILESILKFLAAVTISFYENDRLILYGLLIALIFVIIRVVKWIFCINKYKNIKFSFKSITNLSLFKKMFSFAGWNLFGSLSSIVKTQGLAVLLNIYFGPISNAAYAIANQVSAQLSSFSENMLKALRPQIVKSEGSGNRSKMLMLTFISSKYAYFLLSFISLPIFFNLEFILNIWLKKYPENSIIFTKLAIIISMINLLTIGIRTAVQAIGDIKNYQMIVGGILIFNLPLAYLFLYMGFDPEWIFITSIFVEILALFFRVYFLRVVASTSILSYFRNVVFKALLPTFVICVLFYFLNNIYIVTDFYDFFFYFIIFNLLYFSIIWFLSLNQYEKFTIINLYKTKFNEK